MADVDTLGVCLPQNWGRNGGWVQVSSWDLTLTYQGGEKGLLKLCLKLHKLMGMARIIWLKMHFKMLPRGMRI